MIRATWTRLTTASPAALAVGLACVHGIVALLAFDPTPHSGGDAAAYLTLAESLLTRGAYLQLWDPLAHAHAQYPPGFPALLAGALAVGIDSWWSLKLLMVLTSALAVSLAYMWMRTRGAPGVAFGVGLILALSPGIVQNSHWILSDVPFWAATMATLWMAARDRPAGAAGFAFVALALRTAGLPVVLAVAAWLALRGRWRWAVGVVGLLGLLVLGWTLRADVPYASDLWLADPYAVDEGTIGLGGLLLRIFENAGVYGFRILMELLVGATGVVPRISAGVLLAFGALGWVRGLRRPGVPEILLPLYLGMILAWPGAWAADRMLLPVLPVILVFAAEGVAVLPRRTPGLLRVAATLLFIAASVAPLAAQWRWGARCRDAAAEFPTRCLHPELRAFLALAAWTEGRLPPGSAVLSRKPTFFHFFGRVPGRVYPFTTREGALFEEAERAGARYVVMDRLGAVSSSYLLPVVAAHPDRFCVVQAMELEGSEAVLLGILPGNVGGPAPRTRSGDGAVEVDFPVCPAGYLR